MALLHQGAGSTIDHFLRGPLEALGAQIVEIDSAVPPTATQAAELADCALVVVVRYLSRPWLAPLAADWPVAWSAGCAHALPPTRSSSPS